MQFAYWCIVISNIPTGYVRRDRCLNHKYLQLLIFCQIYEIIIQQTYLNLLFIFRLGNLLYFIFVLDPVP